MRGAYALSTAASRARPTRGVRIRSASAIQTERSAVAIRVRGLVAKGIKALPGVPLASRWRSVFEPLTTVVMLGLAAVFVWQGWTRSSSPQPARARVLSVPRDPIAIFDRPIRGVQTAQIAVVVYSDFQCPFCGVVARDTLPALVRDDVDTGNVRLAFKHLPLAIHPLASAAAAATECAAQQGRFWQMHDRLFKEPVRLADSDLRSAAVQAGVDLKVYRFVSRWSVCRRDRGSRQVGGGISGDYGHTHVRLRESRVRRKGPNDRCPDWRQADCGVQRDTGSVAAVTQVSYPSPHTLGSAA